MVNLYDITPNSKSDKMSLFNFILCQSFPAYIHNNYKDRHYQVPQAFHTKELDLRTLHVQSQSCFQPFCQIHISVSPKELHSLCLNTIL